MSMGLELRNDPNKLSDREKALQILRDPKQLPSTTDIKKAFRSFQEYDYGSNSHGEEIVRGFVDDNEFQAQLSEKGSSQEILNQEFISALSDHLIKELKQKGEPTVILEVGAGNGRLAYFLSQALTDKAPGKFNIIATNKADEKWDIKPVFNVENMDYKDALERYKPDIVVSSWMPPGKDWTADFRNTPSVQEYLLIGEMDSTGDAGLTWGVGKENPYEKDGFDCQELIDISNTQIGREGLTTVRPQTYAFSRQERI